MNFYYINMDRSIDRKEHFLNQCSVAGIPEKDIIRFPALDGSTYQFTDYELGLFSKADFLRRNNKLKLMGNQLSHYYILKDIIARELPLAVVFQDDSIFRKDFLKILKRVIKYLPGDT